MYWRQDKCFGGRHPARARRCMQVSKGMRMYSRTTQRTVRFLAAFSLPGFEDALPPGEYRVDDDEEPIEAGSRLAWRRVATFIHLPAIPATGPMQQMVPIDPAFLEAALEQDRKQS